MTWFMQADTFCDKMFSSSLSLPHNSGGCSAAWALAEIRREQSPQGLMLYLSMSEKKATNF
jgi:hypothetical protein